MNKIYKIYQSKIYFLFLLIFSVALKAQIPAVNITPSSPTICSGSQVSLAASRTNVAGSSLLFNNNYTVTSYVASYYSTSYISLSNGLYFGTGQLGNQFTLETWIYPTMNEDYTYHGVIGYADNGTNVSSDGSQRPPCLYIYNGSQIHGGFGDGSNWNNFQTGPVLVPNVWSHVAVTFNGTSLICYVNGTIVYTTNAFSGRTIQTSNG